MPDQESVCTHPNTIEVPQYDEDGNLLVTWRQCTECGDYV